MVRLTSPNLSLKQHEWQCSGASLPAKVTRKVIESLFDITTLKKALSLLLFTPYSRPNGGALHSIEASTSSALEAPSNPLPTCSHPPPCFNLQWHNGAW